MKTLIFYSIFSLMFVVSATATADGDDVIANSDLTVPTIQKIFEDAYYEIVEVNEKENYMLVKDIWKVYIDLDQEKKYITYSLTWSTSEEASFEEKLGLINLISTKVLMVAPYASVSSGNIVIKHDLWVEGGVTKKNIILTHKAFVKSLHLILELDKDYILN